MIYKPDYSNERVLVWLFFIFLTVPLSLLDLSSLTKDGTCAPCSVEAGTPTHWTTREVPVLFFALKS